MDLKEKLINMTKKANEDMNKRAKEECLNFMPEIIELMEKRAAKGKNHITIQFDIKYKDFSYFEVTLNDDIIIRYDDGLHREALKNFLRSYFKEKVFHVQGLANDLYIHW